MYTAKVFTSFNFAYAPRAALLARSLRKHEPQAQINALVVDEINSKEAGKCFDLLEQYFDRVVLANELTIPDFSQWMFKHNVVEACTAVKPRFLELLLKEGTAPVIYMDPDTCCFYPYIQNLLNQHPASILLTPHQLTPNDSEQSVFDNELGSTKYGVFNLGFAGVRSTEEGLKFAAWWKRSCEMACYEEVAKGIFTDQKWCDLVPAFFSDFSVVRDQGMNVASWNLSTRKIAFDSNGVPIINASPLKFFHFTKVGSVGNEMIARYAETNIEAFELLRWYSQELEKAEAQFPKASWAYGSFNDGTKIPDQWRIAYRHRKDLRTQFHNPFQAEGTSLKSWCSSNLK